MLISFCNKRFFCYFRVALPTWQDQNWKIRIKYTWSWQLLWNSKCFDVLHDLLVHYKCVMMCGTQVDLCKPKTVLLKLWSLTVALGTPRDRLLKKCSSLSSSSLCFFSSFNNYWNWKLHQSFDPLKHRSEYICSKIRSIHSHCKFFLTRLVNFLHCKKLSANITGKLHDIHCVLHNVCFTRRG